MIAFYLKVNQADNLLNLAFAEINVKALRAGLKSASGHLWPAGLSLRTSVIETKPAKLWERQQQVPPTNLGFTPVTHPASEYRPQTYSAH